jgi:hypothetical protein
MGMGGPKQPVKKEPIPIIIPNISNNKVHTNPKKN